MVVDIWKGRLQIFCISNLKYFLGVCLVFAQVIQRCERVTSGLFFPHVPLRPPSHFVNLILERKINCIF